MGYYGYTNQGDQGVILNGSFVSGVQHVQTQTNFNLQPIFIAGIGALKHEISQPLVPEISLEQIVTNLDVIPNLLSGNNILSGLIKHKNSILSFNSGVFTNYSLSCRVGDLIKSSSSIQCFGRYEYTANTGQFDTQPIVPASGLNIPNYSSIVVGLNDSLIDRVVGFTFELKLDQQPVYAIGSRFCKEIKLKTPVEASISFEIEIEETKLKEITTYFCNQYKENVSLLVNTKCSNVNILSLYLDGAELKSQRLNGQVGNMASITFEFVKYYNSLPLLASDNTILSTPIGRYVLDENTFGDKIPPLTSTIQKIDTYTISSNLNF